MSLDAINAELARAIDELVEQCETFVARLRTEVVPGLVAGIRASLLCVRACPSCRRHYAIALSEERPVMCCERELPPDLVELTGPTPVWWPQPGQFVDAPVLVLSGGGSG